MHVRNRLALLVLAAVAAPASSAAAQAPLPAGVTQAMVDKGKTIFGSTGLCYACHGKNAEGLVGPKLVEHEWLHSKGSYPEIVEFVTKGVTPDKAKYGAKSGMPAKGGSSISDDDVKAVAAYVYVISRTK